MCFKYSETEVVKTPSEGKMKKLYQKETSPFPSELHHLLYDDNPYLKSGYKKLPVDSYWKCFMSMFQWHNETMNIWTHFIPFLYFSYGALMYATKTENQNIWLGFFPNVKFVNKFDQFMVVFYLVTASITWALSTFYHMFRMNSSHAYHFCLTCDLRGIVVLLFGSNVLMSYLTFRCSDRIRDIWFLIELFFGFALLLWITRMVKYRLTNQRSIYFSMYSLLGALSIFHHMILILINYPGFGQYFELVPDAYKKNAKTNFSQWEFCIMLLKTCWNSYLISGLGLVVRNLKFPERLFPHVFDYVGASHQLFHIITAIGAFQTIYSSLVIYNYGLFPQCPA